MKQEVSPALSITSDEDTRSIEKLGSEYDLKHHSDLDISIGDDEHAPCGIDLDSDVDIERDRDNEE